MNMNLAPYILSSAFCFVFTLLIMLQAYLNPNMLRILISVHSLFTLAASTVSTLEVGGIIGVEVNSLVYLASSLILVNLHFVMILNVGRKLHMGEATWKHPLILTGVVFLAASNGLIISEITIIEGNLFDNGPYPVRTAFIASIVCAILSDIAIFTFTFQPLIYWRKSRLNENHSKTTALGVWFFVIQDTWYLLYGGLYLTFFVVDSWSYFNVLLSVDYVLRLVESMMYAWPPPRIVINYLTSFLPNDSSHSTGKSQNYIIMMSNEQHEDNINDKSTSLDLTPTEHTSESKITGTTVL